MSARAVRMLRRATTRQLATRDERGSMTLLVIGCLSIAVLLILGTVVATTAQINRVRLLDVADGAALDAADAIDMEAYRLGFDDAVRISNGTVWESAESYLAARERPERITSWRIEQGTGTPDGQTAVVIVSGQVRLPVVGPLLEAVGGSVTITVRGDALAGLVG